HRKRHHQPPFDDLRERMPRDRKERIEGGGAVEREAERKKMQRQEYREREAGEPVQQRGDEPPLAVRRAHHATKAGRAARRPRTSKTSANAASATSRLRPRQAVHSRSTLRSPIGAWTATATTKMRYTMRNTLFPWVRASTSAAVMPARAA